MPPRYCGEQRFVLEQRSPITATPWISSIIPGPAKFDTVISALAGKLPSGNIAPDGDETVAVTRIVDEHGHGHHVGETAAGLLENRIDPPKGLPRLRIEAHHLLALLIAEAGLTGQPDDAPAVVMTPGE